MQIPIAIEAQPLRVSFPAEEVNNPLLLFGREQPFAVVIAIVRGVSA